MTALVTSSAAPALVEKDIRDHSPKSGKPQADLVRLTYRGLSKTSAVAGEQARSNDPRLGAEVRNEVMPQQMPPLVCLICHEDRGGRQGQRGQRDQRDQRDQQDQGGAGQRDQQDQQDQQAQDGGGQLVDRHQHRLIHG